MREQLFALDAGDEIPNPPAHPYLLLWLGCRRYGQKTIAPDGTLVVTPCLPFAGGYADQPAEVMQVFDLLEQLLPELEEMKKRREEAHRKVAENAAALAAAHP